MASCHVTLKLNILDLKGLYVALYIAIANITTHRGHIWFKGCSVGTDGLLDVCARVMGAAGYGDGPQASMLQLATM